MRTIISTVIIIVAAIIGAFLGMGMNEPLNGAILFAVIARFKTRCYLANSLFVGKSSHTGRDILFTEVNNMDQIKTGKFIVYLRKQHNLTQEALGEKLGVTNKTVSRWENANYMGIVWLAIGILELCIAAILYWRSKKNQQ